MWSPDHVGSGHRVWNSPEGTPERTGQAPDVPPSQTCRPPANLGPAPVPSLRRPWRLVWLLGCGPGDGRPQPECVPRTPTERQRMRPGEHRLCGRVCCVHTCACTCTAPTWSFTRMHTCSQTTFTEAHTRTHLCEPRHTWSLAHVCTHLAHPQTRVLSHTQPEEGNYREGISPFHLMTCPSP